MCRCYRVAGRRRSLGRQPNAFRRVTLVEAVMSHATLVGSMNRIDRSGRSVRRVATDSSGCRSATTTSVRVFRSNRETCAQRRSGCGNHPRACDRARVGTSPPSSRLRQHGRRDGHRLGSGSGARREEGRAHVHHRAEKGDPREIGEWTVAPGSALTLVHPTAAPDRLDACGIDRSLAGFDATLVVCGESATAARMLRRFFVSDFGGRRSGSRRIEHV